MTVGEGGRERATVITSNPSQWHGVGEEAPLAGDLRSERGSTGDEGSQGWREEAVDFPTDGVNSDGGGAKKFGSLTTSKQRIASRT